MLQPCLLEIEIISGSFSSFHSSRNIREWRQVMWHLFKSECYEYELKGIIRMWTVCVSRWIVSSTSQTMSRVCTCVNYRRSQRSSPISRQHLLRALAWAAVFLKKGWIVGNVLVRRLTWFAQPAERDCPRQARHHRGYGAAARTIAEDVPAAVDAPAGRLGSAPSHTAGTRKGLLMSLRRCCSRGNTGVQLPPSAPSFARLTRERVTDGEPNFVRRMSTVAPRCFN